MGNSVRRKIYWERHVSYHHRLIKRNKLQLRKLKAEENESHEIILSHVYSRLTCYIPMKKLIANN